MLQIRFIASQVSESLVQFSETAIKQSWCVHESPYQTHTGKYVSTYKHSAVYNVIHLSHHCRSTYGYSTS